MIIENIKIKIERINLLWGTVRGIDSFRIIIPG